MSESRIGCPNCSKSWYEGRLEGHNALLKHVEKSLADAYNSRPVQIKVDVTPEDLEALRSTSTNTAMPKCCKHHTANKGCAFFPVEHNCGNQPCIALRHS